MELKHFNTADWPWDKTIYEIADRVGLEPNQVRQVMRMIRPRQKVHTLKWELKYGKLPWDKMDWSKSNQFLSREHKVDISVISGYRRDNRKPHPTPPPPGSHITAVLTDEQIGKIDWVNYSDAEIGQKFGVTRERVRQIRMRLGVGASKVQNMSSVSRHAFRWLMKNKHLVEGKHINDVIVMMDDPSNQHVIRKQIRNMTSKLGFELLWDSQVKKHVGNSEFMNFRLPNQTLATIWNSCSATVANYRHQWRKVKPKWRCGGFSKQHTHPSYIEEVYIEIDKANKRGRGIDAATTCQILRVPVPNEERLNLMNQKTTTTNQ